jgi:hypothetical protein
MCKTEKICRLGAVSPPNQPFYLCNGTFTPPPFSLACMKSRSRRFHTRKLKGDGVKIIFVPVSYLYYMFHTRKGEGWRGDISKGAVSCPSRETLKKTIILLLEASVHGRKNVVGGSGLLGDFGSVDPMRICATVNRSFWKKKNGFFLTL